MGKKSKSQRRKALALNPVPLSDSDPSGSSDSSGSEEDPAHPLDKYLQRRSSGKPAVATATAAAPEDPPGEPPEASSDAESGEVMADSSDEDFDEALANGAMSEDASLSGGQTPDIDLPASPPAPEDSPGGVTSVPATDGAAAGDEDDTAAVDGRPAKKARTSVSAAVPQALSALERQPPPTGVTVLAEGEQNVRNAQLDRLLRMPRYFDDDFAEAGRRCFKCGGLGHMSRDCTNASKDRACFLCAEFGHDSRDCPNSLCWKCQRPGHVSRDCPYNYTNVPAWDPAPGQSAVVCMRCGREDCPCAGQPDYVRAEGGCTRDYKKKELNHVRCFVCHARGHLSCGQAPPQLPRSSCLNCGGGGHTVDECPKERPHVIRAERSLHRRTSGGGGNYQQQQQYASTSGRPDQYQLSMAQPGHGSHGSGYYGGGGSRYYDAGAAHGQYTADGRLNYASYSAYSQIEQPRYGGGGGGGGDRKRSRATYEDVRHVSEAAHYTSKGYNGQHGYNSNQRRR